MRAGWLGLVALVAAGCGPDPHDEAIEAMRAQTEKAERLIRETQHIVDAPADERPADDGAR